MFTLPALPYGPAALEPFISARTMELHHGKHHQAYVDNLNKLIRGTELEGLTLEEIILKTTSDPDKSAIFNNAGQHFNHSFFWRSLQPITNRTEPGEAVVTAIAASFGSLDNFYEEFKIAAGGLFGSGWVWLVKEGGALRILKMSNADNSVAHGLKPIFALDVWEHSYYLDYQNRRGDFADAVLKNLINWSVVEENL